MPHIRELSLLKKLEGFGTNEELLALHFMEDKHKAIVVSFRTAFYPLKGSYILKTKLMCEQERRTRKDSGRYHGRERCKMITKS